METEVLTSPITNSASMANQGGLLNMSVLIVEDERINFYLIDLLLRKMVTRVDHAVNGLIAIDLIAKNHYDLIFMDMNMPIMGGIAATKILRKQYPELPIIALTCSMLAEDIHSTLEAGCNEFLYKPPVKNRLEELVRKYAPAENSTH